MRVRKKSKKIKIKRIKDRKIVNKVKISSLGLKNPKLYIKVIENAFKNILFKLTQEKILNKKLEKENYELKRRFVLEEVNIN